MRRLKYNLFLLICLLMPGSVLATDYVVCGNDYRFPLVVANLFSILITVIRLIVPILLVISGMISFLKVTFSSKVEEDLKKAKNKLIDSIVAAVIIFFIVSIVNFAIAFVIGKNNDAQGCIKCFLKPDSCVHEDSLGTRLCPGFMEDLDKYDENCNLIDDNSNTESDNNQSNNNSKENNNESKIVLIDGVDGVTVGDEVAIGTEHFYVVSSNESETVLLAKYNLYVGSICTSDSSDSCTKIDTNVDGYGFQNEKARGYVSDTDIRIGTLAFSDVAYWLNSDGSFKAVYRDYSAFNDNTVYHIYDPSSNLFSYVEQYKLKIQDLGVHVKDARILNLVEVLNLEKSQNDKLSLTHSWVDGGFINKEYSGYVIQCGKHCIGHGYKKSEIAGIRPVIVVNTSDIKK